MSPADTLVTLEDIYAKITNATATAYNLDSPATATGTMHTLDDIYNRSAEGYYGRGWVASTTGTDAITVLTKTACEAATDWKWFEDGNGDGDTTDPEDGVCVKTTTRVSDNWAGTETSDNSYIMSYNCTGSFPNGTTTPAGANACALCVADCYDGRRDLPNQGTYTVPDTSCTASPNCNTCYEGPLTPNVLKKWKGTRLPSMNDFFGFCGYKNGGSDYETGCSSDKTKGSYGTMSGRTDECLDLSNSASYEWLSEQIIVNSARVAGYYACSYSNYNFVFIGFRFRAVFRP
jgi:hypothetical protein